jgi:hypothetical protein
MEHTERKFCSLWNNVDSGRWLYFSSRLFRKIGALYRRMKIKERKLIQWDSWSVVLWEMAKPSGSLALAKENATHRELLTIAASYLLNLSLVSDRNFLLTKSKLSLYIIISRSLLSFKSHGSL